MNIDEIVKKLEPWKERHDSMMAQYEAMKKITGADPDCALFQSVFGIWEAYTEAVGELVGDKNKWLQWYELDCDMGRNAQEAVSDTGTTLRVRTLRQLARAISW